MLSNIAMMLFKKYFSLNPKTYILGRRPLAKQ